MAGNLCYDTGLPSGYSTLKQLYTAVRDRKIGKAAGELREGLEVQDAFTLHRPVRKKFPSNPYSVNNIMDVRECDSVDVQGLSKYKDGINIC